MQPTSLSKAQKIPNGDIGARTAISGTVTRAATPARAILLPGPEPQ